MPKGARRPAGLWPGGAGRGRNTAGAGAGAVSRVAREVGTVACVRAGGSELSRRGSWLPAPPSAPGSKAVGFQSLS